MMPFFCIHISQGSAATCLKRGGIFKQEFVANLLLSPLVKKKIENRMTVGEVMAKSLVSCFLTHGVVYLLLNTHSVQHADTNIQRTHITIKLYYLDTVKKERLQLNFLHKT